MKPLGQYWCIACAKKKQQSFYYTQSCKLIPLNGRPHNLPVTTQWLKLQFNALCLFIIILYWSPTCINEFRNVVCCIHMPARIILKQLHPTWLFLPSVYIYLFRMHIGWHYLQEMCAKVSLKMNFHVVALLWNYTQRGNIKLWNSTLLKTHRICRISWTLPFIMQYHEENPMYQMSWCLPILHLNPVIQNFDFSCIELLFLV